jgi:hypothetical protein
MKPVDQTTFGPRDGNCFSACIASILELPISEVPWFMGGQDDRWMERNLLPWLAPRGLYAICFGLRGPDDWVPPGYYIVGGESARGGCLHSVVALAGKTVHDPHPSRAGVKSHDDGTILVPLDIAEWRRQP